MGLFQSFYTHWLLNSGHKASLLSLPFTSFTAVSICALPATSPPQTPSKTKEKPQYHNPSPFRTQETRCIHALSQQGNWGPVLRGTTTQTGTRAERDPPNFHHLLPCAQQILIQVLWVLFPCRWFPSLQKPKSWFAGPGKASSSPGSGNITDAKLQRGKHSPFTNKSQPTGLSWTAHKNIQSTLTTPAGKETLGVNWTLSYRNK